MSCYRRLINCKTLCLRNKNRDLWGDRSFKADKRTVVHQAIILPQKVRAMGLDLPPNIADADELFPGSHAASVSIMPIRLAVTLDILALLQQAATIVRRQDKR